MDFSVIEKLGKEEKYTSQKDEYEIQLRPEDGQRDPRGREARS